MTPGQIALALLDLLPSDVAGAVELYGEVRRLADEYADDRAELVEQLYVMAEDSDALADALAGAYPDDF